MPLYQYLCLDCGTRYDALEKFEEQSPNCPKCGHPTGKRELSAPSLKFIGNGWPSNDAKTIIGAK